MTSSSSMIEEDYATQHFIIGENLRTKGFYIDAINELEKSYRKRERELGSSHLDTAKTNYSLGLAYRSNKQYYDALHHLHEALGTFETTYNDYADEKDVIEKLFKQQDKAKTNDDSTSNDSSKEEEEDDDDDNELNKNIKKFKAIIERCKLNIARTNHSYGLQLQHLGKHDEAIIQYKLSIEIREELLGTSHLETARTYYTLGCALCIKQLYDESLVELRRALRIRVLIFENDEHIDVLEVLEDIATVIQLRDASLTPYVNPNLLSDTFSNLMSFSLNQIDELERSTNALGDMIGESLSNFGIAIGTYPSQTEQQHEHEQQQHHHHGTTTRPKRNSTSSSSSGGSGGKKPFYNRHHQDQPTSPPKDEEQEDYRIAVIKSVNYELEGDLNMIDKDYDQAVTDYHFALGVEEKYLGEYHPVTSDLYLKVANALSLVGDLESSLKEYKSAIAIYEEIVGKFHPNVATVYVKVAKLLEEQQNYEAALSLYTKAYTIFDSTLGNCPSTLNAFNCVRNVCKKGRQQRKDAKKAARKKAEAERNRAIARRNRNNNNNNKTRKGGTKLKKKKKTIIEDPRRRNPNLTIPPTAANLKPPPTTPTTTTTTAVNKQEEEKVDAETVDKEKDVTSAAATTTTTTTTSTDNGLSYTLSEDDDNTPTTTTTNGHNSNDKNDETKIDGSNGVSYNVAW